ncbi:hypothetical protein [Chromatium okenii]
MDFKSEWSKRLEVGLMLADEFDHAGMTQLAALSNGDAGGE